MQEHVLKSSMAFQIQFQEFFTIPSMSYHERCHALIRVELLHNIPVDRFKLWPGYPSKSRQAENEQGYSF